MKTPVLPTTLHWYALITICVASASCTVPTMGQDTQLSPSAQVLTHLREQDYRSALDVLGKLVDEGVLVGGLAYSDLPSSAGGLYRSLAQLSTDEQYELLEKWTLPNARRNEIRLLSIPVPTDAPPKVFARSLGQRPRNSSFTIASVGPVLGFFCSGWMFIQAADDLGRLARLRLRLEKLAAADVVGAQELLMLAHLAGDRGELGMVHAYLQNRNNSEMPEGMRPQDMHVAVVASAALLHRQLQSQSESLLKRLVNQSGQGKAIGLRPFLRIAHATAVQMHHGESTPESLFHDRFKDWVPATIRTAAEIEQGQPRAIWITRENHVLHLAGGTANVLFCRFPIVGEFDFVCETQAGGVTGTDGGLVYGGLHYQTLGRKDALRIWDPDFNHSVTRPSPFASYDNHAVFNRVSIRSRSQRAKFESNFHPVSVDGSATRSSPWIGLRSSGIKRPVFRNLRLTGQPVIPREVHLTVGDQLRGWQAGFFGETQPSFQHDRDPSEQLRDSFDWQLKSSELVAAKHADTTGSTQPGLLRYERPLLAGEAVSYRFFHQEPSSIVHPVIGRLAFLIESTGIRVRWITTGQSEWTCLEANNAAIEPLNRRGPRRLPLREGAWNTVRVELVEGGVLIKLNNTLVYERELKPGGETQFGLYRATRAVESRVRDVIMTGDWPETVPGDFLENLVALVSADTPRRDHQVRGRVIGQELLAKNVVEFRRRAAREPADTQFEMLCRWVLPRENRTSFRITSYFVPDGPSPGVLADAAFRSVSIAERLVGRTTDQSLVSPVFDLLRVAARDNRLPELRRRIESGDFVEDAKQAMSKAALLALVMLHLGDTEAAAPLIAGLHQSVPLADASDLNELWPATLVAYSCVHDFPDAPGGDDLVASLYTSHAKPVGSLAPKSWQSQILGLMSEVRLRLRTAAGGDIESATHVSGWIPMTTSSARTRGLGGASARWIGNPQGEMSMSGGQDIEFLGLESPLRGNYTIEVDVASNSTTQVLHAGEYSGPGNSAKNFKIGKLGKKHRFVPLDTPFGKTKSWVRYRVTVRDNTEQVFLNGRRIRQRTLPGSFNPWFAIRGWYKSDARFRDVRIGGSPTIPDQVRLDSSPDLCGWLAYFGESVGTAESHWQRTDHRAGEGVLVGARLDDIRGSFCERLLRYHRPLVENGSIEFEFYYEPGIALTSPAIDRLAFVFTPNGVTEHWVTDGRFDVTEMRPDHQQRHDSFQRGSHPLPLESKAWNHVELQFSGATLSIVLNKSLVYQRPLDPTWDRMFGLFHFADQHEMVARNISMRGDWPKQLPSPQPLEDPRAGTIDAGLPELEAVFTHDFRSRQRTQRFIHQLAFGSEPNVTHVLDGVRVTLDSSGEWKQCALSPSFSVVGDFDVEASFTSLDFGEPKSGQVQLAVQLTDPFNRNLISGIGQDEWHGPSARGRVALTYPDGSKRFVNTNLADESTSGRLRIARRGDQFYAMFAQGDSPHWRVLEQETVSTGNIDFGGIQLVTIANGRGGASVVWNDLSLRAQQLLFQAPDSQKPARILSIFRVDGSETRDLTPADNPVKMLASPAWSPDGKRIAYEHFPEKVDDARIMIVDVDGGPPIDLGAGTMPAFSPNGKQIVFSARGEGIGMMNADGSNRRILSRSGWGLLWTPDGKQLTYSSRRNIILRDLDDDRGRALLSNAVESRYTYLYWNLAWSPDGQRIVFNGLNRQTKENELAMVSRDSPGKVQVLYRGLQHQHVDHCWSPSGDQILVPIERPGTIGLQLYLLDSAGVREPQRMRSGPADRIVFGADWSPDGNWIAVTAQPMMGPAEWRQTETTSQPESD